VFQALSAGNTVQLPIVARAVPDIGLGLGVGVAAPLGRGEGAGLGVGAPLARGEGVAPGAGELVGPGGGFPLVPPEPEQPAKAMPMKAIGTHGARISRGSAFRAALLNRETFRVGPCDVRRNVSS